MIETLLAFAADNPFLVAPLAVMLGFLVWNTVSSGELKQRIRSGQDPDARMEAYAWTIGTLWALAAVCVAGWLASGRTLTDLGFRIDGGLLALAGWAIAAAGIAYMIWSVVSTAVSPKARASFRKQILDGDGDYDLVRPETPREHIRFQLTGLTAGITEEIIFRGFLIGVLALLMPLWAAALASILVFVLGHAYQGPAGMVRVTLISVVFTLVFLMTGSLWPVIALHIFTDASAGALFRLIQIHVDEDAARASAGSA